MSELRGEGGQKRASCVVNVRKTMLKPQRSRGIVPAKYKWRNYGSN